jgi:signal transduction histidine kinase
VYNYADLLEDNEDNNLNDEQLMFISTIKKQSMFMVNMVNDLLDFSAIESGEINLNKGRTNIVDIISETVVLTDSLASRKAIKLNFDRFQRVENLYIDGDKIEQVITNLLTNAIKFSKKNTLVIISLSESPRDIVVEVKDHGLGIKEGELSRLFKPFNKTSTRGTSGEKSTGLGLYICKRIIEAHQGRIWAESVYGEGSSFFFSLPKGI